MELKQNLTEEELFSIIGRMNVNLYLANNNIQKLIVENKNLNTKLAKFENNVCMEKDIK